MGEPQEQPERPEPEMPEEGAESAPEPTEAPGEGDGPVEGDEPAEAPSETPVQRTGPSGEKEIEKVFDRLGKEAKRHRDRLSEIMADDATLLIACPLCDPLIPGFIMPTPDVPERFPAVREFMGESPASELSDDPRSMRCEVCDGFGQVATGSRTEAHKAMVCEACKGMGAVGPRFEQPQQIVSPVAPLPAANGPAFAPTAEPEPPEVAAVKAMGYQVIPPFKPAPATVGG
jgi:hypothetical protein